MGKSLVRLIVVFALVAAVIAGGVVLSLPLLVSTETARTAIERELSAFFGTRARLDGATDIRLFPRPQAILENVTIAGNGPGAPALLTAETMTVDIRRGGSLLGQPSFSGYRLVRPHLRVTQNSDGQIDWSYFGGQLGQMVRALAPAQAVNDADTADRSLPHATDELGRLGQVVVENGRITIADGHGAASEELSSIDMTLNWPEFAAAMTVSGDAIWRGAQLAVQGRLEAPEGISTGSGSPLTFSVRSEVANLSFQGSASLAQPLFAEGAVEFETPSMRTLLGVLQTDVPPGSALGSVGLTGPVRLAQRRMVFEGVAIEVDGNVGTGALELTLGNVERLPAVSGTLDFPSLELDTFLAAFDNLYEPAPKPSPARLNADLRLSTSTATFGELQLSQLAATVQVSDSVAIFDIGDALAYGGHIQARLTVDPDQAGRHREIMLSGQNVDTGLIGAEFGLPEMLPRGRGKFSVALNGAARGWANLVASADGYVALEMTDGALPGLGVKTFIDRRDEARYFSIDTSAPAERFTRAVINGDIHDGVVNFNNTAITYDDGMLDLTGIVSIATGSLALTATAVPADQGENGSASTAAPRRYFIGGSWNRPFATPVLPPL